MKKKKIKIGVLCEPKEKRDKVRHELYSNLKFQAVNYESVDQLLNRYLDDQLDGVVIAVNSDEEDLIHSRVISSFIKFPVIFLSEFRNLHFDKRFLKRKYKVQFLSFDDDLGHLTGFLNRLFDNEENEIKRTEVRHTVPLVEVDFLINGQRGQCLITDISDGGSGIIVKGHEVSYGETLSLRLPFRNEDGFEYVRAKVCWEQTLENSNQGSLKKIGLQFEQKIAMCA